MKPYSFKSALPVWEIGKDKEMNYNLVFRSVVDKNENTVVALSASSMYQMFVNGVFVSEGPARAGHGYYRVDEIDISKYLTNDKNIVCIYVDGYYVENYYLIKSPSFLCAEIVANSKVISATGKYGFEAKYHTDRIRKVIRFSGQRTFAEAYRYDEAYRDFDTKLDSVFEKVNLEVTDDRHFIQRGVPYPCYNECDASQIVAQGTAEFSEGIENPVTGWYFDCPDMVRNFEDIEIINTDEVDKGKYTCIQNSAVDGNGAELDADSFVIFKMPTEKTGFIRFDAECECDTELICIFDEVLDNGDVTTTRLDSLQRSVVWFLKKGKYSIITNEPYSVHYIKFANRGGAVRLANVGVTEFAAKVPDIKPCSDNQNLNLIYEAGIETYKQNAIDIFTDCPSRERAGWLCDSFFTARVEKEIFGKNEVERNFLENFIYCENPHHIDDKMVPMCYPADHINENFIPNWAMWYVLELEEYLERSGDRELIDLSKPKVDNLLTYFRRFENNDGLLENLEKWVFVDFTKANDFVNGVNYPSNMLYAKMLEAASHLYGDTSLLEKAEKIRETVRVQAYRNGFFRDHAIRNENGNLELVMADTTESCQYYAFFTGTAAKETYPELYETIINEFGPNNNGKYPDIVPANAFIGLYIRLDMLSQDGDRETVLRDIEGCFTHMARTTGTLWEDKDGTYSCNHGFGSHVLVWLNKFAE